jgi:streptogramin lyase
MRRSKAEIIREYGPFPGVDHVHGVSYDGRHVWFAAGDKLTAMDPASGKTVRSIEVAAHAGTAFDGRHLFQIAENRIQKIDPKTGRVVATIPAPGGGGDSGLAWAEGTLWVGQYRDRKIYQIDPETGAIGRSTKSILKQARFFARSSRTALSLESRGSTESSGTGLRKTTKVI